MVLAGIATPGLCGAADSSVAKVWRSTSNAAFRSGVVPEDGVAPAASEASRNSPDFWKADSMSPPSRPVLSGVCCASTSSTACFKPAGRSLPVTTEARFANSGAWLPCFVTASEEAVVTATCSAGVSVARGALPDGASGGLSTNAAARGVNVIWSPAASPAPLITARRMVPSFLDTASWRFCPGASATSDVTSIARLAIAIRTRLSAITLTTLASTMLPACSTRSGVVASATGLAAVTGRMDVTGVGIFRGSTKHGREHAPTVTPAS